MSLPRSYDAWRLESHDDRPHRINHDARDWTWFSILPEDDNEPEREFRVSLSVAGDGEWEITSIEEDTREGFLPLRGSEYDEIHELAINDQGVISAAMEMWL